VLATYPIINSCNISCPWCAAHLSSQPIFNTHHVLRALGRVKQKLHGVALTGGEPFTNPKILDIKSMLEAHGHRVFAITNGTLHDKIWEFVTGNTLDIAMSIHNPMLFPAEVVLKKAELMQGCRNRGLKIMAGLFSVDNETDIYQAISFILENRDIFQTFTLSTIYRPTVPAMSMSELERLVMSHLPASAKVLFWSVGKVVIDIDGYVIALRRSPTLEEYSPEYDIPGCLFLAWDGEFYPVAYAQYYNEEVLA
jgi:hypothetical protein